MKDTDLRIDNYVMSPFGEIVKFRREDFGFEERGEYFTPIPITQEWLIKLGYKFYNGQTEGTLTMDFGGKLDVDFYEGKIHVKSHYEGYYLYRPLYIEYVHQLQNLYFATTHEELTINKE